MRIFASPSEAEIQGLLQSTFDTYAPLGGQGAKTAGRAGGGTGGRVSGPAALGMARSSSTYERGARAATGVELINGKHALGCGLENMGNTCYMAAFIQVLVRAHKFTAALLKLPASSTAATSPGNQTVTAVAAEHNDAEDKLVQQLQRLMSTLLLSVRRSVRAEGLLASLPSFFLGGHQQDTAEMARYILASVDGRCHRLFRTLDHQVSFAHIVGLFYPYSRSNLLTFSRPRRAQPGTRSQHPFPLAPQPHPAAKGHACTVGGARRKCPRDLPRCFKARC